jgi:GTP cyclohydrolase III
MKPQSKLWKQISQQAAGYYTLRFAGLFDLQISIHFVFEI